MPASVGIHESSASGGYAGAAPVSRMGEPEVRGSDADLRALAARLLEDQLLRVGRARAVVERQLGQGLAQLASNQIYRRLGYVRLADYVTERLGMSLRRCQTLLKYQRALERLPTLARASAEGALPASRLQVVAAVANPDTESLWLARARRLGVRQLEALARSGASPEGPTTSGDYRLVPVADPHEEPGTVISFRAPGRAVALWHWALELIRRVAGHEEPAWRCVEYLAAEYLSGAIAPDAPGPGDDSAGPSSESSTTRPGGTSAPGTGGSAASQASEGVRTLPDRVDPFGRRGTPAAEVWSAAVAAVREALASLGEGSSPGAILTGLPSGPDRLHGWDLDARLRSLVRLRQSLAWREGRLLGPFTAFRLHREIGFTAVEDWCREVLGMSPRRARYLASLDRRLRSLPLLADAYRRSHVSWCQARSLLRVVGPENEGRWIRYARQVSVRRLDEAIRGAEIETALALGAPPPAEVLPPGWGPRSAEPSRPASPPHPAGRHTSAPPALASSSQPSVAERASQRITFWAPLEVADLWARVTRACRSASAGPLEDWECLLVCIQSLRDTWEDPDDPGWRRRYRIHERDGWRCRVPGCTSRRHLNEHHLIFRSHGGADDEENLVTLCVGHHQEGIHRGRIRVWGEAPDALWWELGPRADGPPLVRYFGERIVPGKRGREAATVSAAGAAGPAEAPGPASPPGAAVVLPVVASDGIAK